MKKPGGNRERVWEGKRERNKITGSLSVRLTGESGLDVYIVFTNPPSATDYHFKGIVWRNVN